MVALPVTNEPFDSAFWHGLREEILPAVEPLFRELFAMGVEIAMGLTPISVKAFGAGAKDILPVDYNVINTAMESLIADYTDSWWDAQEVRARERLRSSLQRHRIDGGGVQAVMDDIRGYFAPSRIESIAVTETTNLFGMGAQATYAAAGITQWQWQTVNDPKVDAVCRALNGKKFDIAVPFRAAHPRCRCFPSPVVFDEPAGKPAPVAAPTAVAAPTKAAHPGSFPYGRVDPRTAPISQHVREMIRASKMDIQKLSDATNELYSEWGYNTVWSGKIVTTRTNSYAFKAWNCDIALSKEALNSYQTAASTVTHEMAHAIGGLKTKMYADPFTIWLEEAATESFSRAVIKRLADEGLLGKMPFWAYENAVDELEAIALAGGWDSGEELAFAIKQHLVDHASDHVDTINFERRSMLRANFTDAQWKKISSSLKANASDMQAAKVREALGLPARAVRGREGGAGSSWNQMHFGDKMRRGPARINAEIDRIADGQSQRIKVLADLLRTATRAEATAFGATLESTLMRWTMPEPDGPGFTLAKDLAPIFDAWDVAVEKYSDGA